MPKLRFRNLALILTFAGCLLVFYLRLYNRTPGLDPILDKEEIILGVKNDKKSKNKTKYLAAGPNKSAKKTSQLKSRKKCLRNGLKTTIRDVNRHEEADAEKKSLLLLGPGYRLMVLFSYLFNILNYN